VDDAARYREPVFDIASLYPKSGTPFLGMTPSQKLDEDLELDEDLGGEPRPHIPVLLAEAMEALAIRPGGSYVDATFGGGSYSRAILASDATIRLLALDRDPEAVRAGAALVREAQGRLTLVEGRFGDIAGIAAENGFAKVDGVVLDIGVSSMQLDRAERGFSFRHDGPLDMRMGAGGRSAADIVAAASLDELADMLRFYGEERHAGRVARAIVAARQQAPIRTTRELRNVIAAALPAVRDGIDPATRTFQALRIAVNDELGELVRGLVGASSLLAPQGRLAVVTFHSLEDRIVKRFLRDLTGLQPALSRHLPGEARDERSFTSVGGPVQAGAAELAENPRARSAKLRFGMRGHAAPPSDISALTALAALPQRGSARRK
jgi:16S rRNA (cytosine1402-N4)-methyltransferase